MRSRFARALASGLATSLAMGALAFAGGPAQAQQYQVAAETTTTLGMTHVVAEYRTVSNELTATVASDAGTPTGSVVFTVSNRGETTVALTDGVARLTLPTTLRARRTYTIAARYVPADANEYKESVSGNRFFTVKPARTTVRLVLANTGRNKRPRASYVLTASNGFVPPAGRVRLEIIKPNRDVRGLRAVKPSAAGRGATVFQPTVRRGVWRISARFAGTTNYAASQPARKTFRVARPAR